MPGFARRARRLLYRFDRLYERAFHYYLVTIILTALIFALLSLFLAPTHQPGGNQNAP